MLTFVCPAVGYVRPAPTTTCCENVLVWPLLSVTFNDTVKVLMARKADTRIPLQRTAWDAWRKKEIAEIEAVSPNLDKQAPKFTVNVIVEPTKPDDRITKWKDGLARDPWVDECVAILGDMKK